MTMWPLSSVWYSSPIIGIEDHQAVKNRSICFVKKSCKLIYGVKFVQNSAVTLHAPGDLSRASLHQSESWMTSGQQTNQVPSFEIQADIFTRPSLFGSPKGPSNTFKTRKNISLYFRTNHLIICLWFIL